MDYSQRFRENLDATLDALPYFSIILFVMSVKIKEHLPECPWMTCFLAMLGIHVLQILFGVTVYSIPKKDSLFFAIVVLAGIILIPVLCLHWMRV
ncbi:hypothetical protein [Akkermansia muciniphila]|uniref:hypothetical protein n=1 Tax=Akkermansia muciniphila TaxID=239935 RepID=UPI000B8EC904|nr:hypothetical protein [Akkermansia muciniphila]